MSSSRAARQPLSTAGAFPAVSMSPVKRFICHFLIVWLALLSGGAHAHATADAAQEVGHIAAHAIEAQLAAADGADPSMAAHEHCHSESCSLSHCGHGHATGMLASAELRFSAAGVGAPLPTPPSWASREQPNSIERPKWTLTTPAVVNL
jgi:hypothetical protein